MIVNEILVDGLEHLDYFSIQLGISSSQLTFTPSFFRGVGLNHQPDGHFHKWGAPKWLYTCFFSWKIYENLTKMDDFGSFNASIWRIPNSRPSWPTSTARGPSTWRRFQHVSTEVSGCFTDVLRIFLRMFSGYLNLWIFMDVCGCLSMFMDAYG